VELLEHEADLACPQRGQPSVTQRRDVLPGDADATSTTVFVRDTGVGIAPENVGRIFDRFWRADDSRSRTTGGSGLGLAIARKLAEAHGGTIEVESRLGAGTVFTVWLHS
jgi:two-component system sensor histidine kinase BaeS